MAISAPLQELVERLAMQLQGEAQAQISAALAEQAPRESHHAEAVDLAKSEARQLEAGFGNVPIGRRKFFARPEAVRSAIFRDFVAHSDFRNAEISRPFLTP